MIPPTIEQVRAHIIKKKYYSVSAQAFWDYYDDMEWEDKFGKPVKRWKGKLATWHHKNLEKNLPPLKCRICGGYGDYAARDDTGQSYRLCEKHKPKHKPALPAEMLDIMKCPNLSDTKDLNAERNRQMKLLAANHD